MQLAAGLVLAVNPRQEDTRKCNWRGTREVKRYSGRRPERADRSEIMNPLTGSCSCGSVRFEIRGRPDWVNVCHCNACKKRTGSAFGFSIVVDPANVKDFVGPTKTFSRVGDSGKPVRYEFCPNCGTTLRWHVELIPNKQVFAGGAFDDPDQFEVFGEMYTDEALSWAKIGCELSRPGAADHHFRNALMKRGKAVNS